MRIDVELEPATAETFERACRRVDLLRPIERKRPWTRAELLELLACMAIRATDRQVRAAARDAGMIE